MIRPSKNTGFTLVEISVSLAVAAIVIGMIMLSYFALQRGYAFAINWSETRVAQVRIIDSMAQDLRNATAVATASGSLPLTLTLPARFNAYETEGTRAGDPHTTSAMNAPIVNSNTGALEHENGTITVIYEQIDTSINRRIQKTGISPDPSRTIAVFDSGISVSFQDQNGAPFTPASNTIVVVVSATANSWISSQTASKTMTDTVFLRGKTAY